MTLAEPVVPLDLREGEVPTIATIEQIVGDIGMACEVNTNEPCTKETPEPAKYIVVWAECNCDPSGPDYQGTSVVCARDMASFASVMNLVDFCECPYCDMKFRPAHKIIKKIVLL